MRLLVALIPQILSGIYVDDAVVNDPSESERGTSPRGCEILPSHADSTLLL
jgi:hypothetical protein